MIASLFMSWTLVAYGNASAKIDTYSTEEYCIAAGAYQHEKGSSWIESKPNGLAHTQFICIPSEYDLKHMQEK